MNNQLSIKQQRESTVCEQQTLEELVWRRRLSPCTSGRILYWRSSLLFLIKKWDIFPLFEWVLEIMLSTENKSKYFILRLIGHTLLGTRQTLQRARAHFVIYVYKNGHEVGITNLKMNFKLKKMSIFLRKLYAIIAMYLTKLDNPRLTVFLIDYLSWGREEKQMTFGWSGSFIQHRY
jgi:hypothetical protein